VNKKGINNLQDFLPTNINNPTDNKKNDMIPVDLLIPYPDHPFKLYEGDRFADMVRSIEEMGILLPIIVRPAAELNKYEILSGHNRVNAAKEAGLLEIPAIVRSDLTDDEARLIVTETNLVQRGFESLSHSERAIALKSHMDAISQQGKRTDLINEIKQLSNPDKIKENDTFSLIGGKLKSDEQTGDKYGLSARNVHRYIRLTHLDKSLQDRVNNEEIGLYPAVSISYLTPNEQTELDSLLTESNYKLNMKKAESLRELSESKKLNNKMMEQVLSGTLNKKPKKTSSATTFVIKRKLYTKYFDGTKSTAEIEAIIDKALGKYFEKYETASPN
jgi:ParB family chromosome partitioning protein